MANHGVGNKFVSVNLNKSYGQSSNHHHQQHYFTSNSSSHGSGRGRAGSGLGGGGGGGGGGMVVLSRPRSSQKSGPKLSVPPPLNLPSLRKEHERFDSSGSGAGTAGGGISGTGSRPTSSGMGWSKPAPIAVQEKEGFVGDHVSDGVDHGSHGGAAVSKGVSGAYMPPSVRSGVSGPSYSVSAQTFSQLDKPTVLRGEDFPSLKAALPSVSGPERKQKDSLNFKQKQPADELYDEPRVGSRSSAQSQFKSDSFGNGLGDYSGRGHGLSGSRASDQAQKQEDYFPGPLPLVRLNPRSDWADDERDTGHGLTDRGNDHGYTKREAYWDRDFDMPRVPLLPHRSAHKPADKWGQRDHETGKSSSGEVTKMDPFNRNVRIPSREGREGNSLRASSLNTKGGFGSQDIASDRNHIGARLILNREKESKYSSSHFHDNAQEDILRRDAGYGQGGKPSGSNTTSTFGSWVSDRNTREQNNRYMGNSFKNGSASKSSFSSGGLGVPDNDPILNFGREKRPYAKNEKLYVEDSFMKDFGAAGFDGPDPFSPSLVGVVKRKKDVLKPTDFHDPVRESFEAELERVQKMQELERQRIMDEQERALELARREEEERLRVAREQEELQRRLEEEAREAAWRAEQERLESVRKAEEQRIAREEEKRKLEMEEERRKQAAKQKLLELEERIAKRQAEASKSGSNSSSVVEERISELVKERDFFKASDLDDWEDGERMVERITTSASETSSLIRPYEGNVRSHFSRDSSSPFSDRGRPFNSWKRDAFQNGNSLTFAGPDTEHRHPSPRQDGSAIGRPFARKDYNAAAGFVSSKLGYHMDEHSHPKDQRWDIHGDGDHFGRISDIESDYRENLAGNYGAIGWGQHSRGNPYPLYPERFYQNHEGEGLSSYGRSRFPMRQPRVLPPPTMYPSQKTTYRGDSEPHDPLNFRENELQYSHPVRSGSTMEADCNSDSQDHLGRSAIVNPQQDNNGNEVQKLDEDIASCASQSSLSVSSPPDSPINLSHDDLDDSGDSVILPSIEGKDVGRSGLGKDPLILPAEAGKDNTVSASNSISAGEDEEWNVETNEQLQEQEEYDEDGDGYQEEDEMHEADGGNGVLSRDFENMHLGEKEPSTMIDHLVLGFNEGFEVRMPTNELERSLRKENTAFASSQNSVGVVAEKGSFQDVPHVGLDNSATIFQETDKAMQDPVIQPSETPQVSTASVVLHASSSALPASHIVTSSVNSTSHISSGPTFLSPSSSAPNQAEIPIKLPFGLFSGPSLIPSPVPVPVPAIQIGSIQMPLHLHPQVGPSVTHMHPSQPLFQFGQLRYTPPISQGVLPLAPQSMSFIQPNISNSFSLNQNAGVPQSIQQAQDTASHGSVSKDGNSLPDRESEKTPANNSACADSRFPSPDQGNQNSVVRSIKSFSDHKESESQHQNVPIASQSVVKEMESSGSRVHGKMYGNRGKRQVFSVKNSNPRSFHSSETFRHDSGGYQRRARHPRTEFRIRENADKKLAAGVLSLSQANPLGSDDKLCANEKRTGYSTRNGVRKAPYVDKSKRSVDSEWSGAGPVSSREIDSGNKGEKSAGKESSMKSQNIPHSGEVNLKRNIHDNVDASLQSGIIRVFDQPGIETPSDEDDFIEVRSKRQMLNDRREQREKEIKAKSRFPKLPRKPRSNMPSTIGFSSSNKGSVSASGEATKTTRTSITANEGFHTTNIEASTGFASGMGSRPLAPIGKQAVKNDVRADLRSQTVKSIQTRALPTPSSGGTNLASGFIFESKKEIMDNVHTPFSSWGNSGINQQVMSLTQTQLDDAMKPVQFESCASIGDQTSTANEPSIPTSSILTKDKSFSSAGSPVNSLLAGEKIQFGVVTTPAVLPSSSLAVSHGIGPPGPSRSEKQISHNISASERDCTLFFEKGKHSNESCIHLEDCEAAAEAAASAVAVAAITNDEVLRSGLGTSVVSAADIKSFGAPDGSAGSPHMTSQSKSEESLSVALPADLSVENPPISLWPPLSSPQKSSGQMISHFSGGPSSHFPFYEMNPMLGAPIFAFGPHDESASTQSQTQNSSAPASSPLGTWQQCHPGVDSFYGPPAGFSGPFISPPGGIQGIQGPPHMVVYKHFAPVGQFGQVGLSFMGATYIPSGKQPDWKHNPVSSGMGIGEGDMSSMNMASSQCNPTNLPAPVQHLAPGSPLMPMASPLAMFDVSPFQARWSHVPASPLQSVPLSIPMQQQAEGFIPCQYNQGPPVDSSLTGSKFHELQSSNPSDTSRRIPVSTDGTVSQLPDELGLVEPSSSRIAGTSTQGGVVKNTSLNPVSDASKKTIIQNSGGSTNTGSTFKTHTSQQNNTSSQHYGYSSGYNHQRGGGVLPKNSSGEWSHRRMGYQGRNQSSGGDKNFPASKKQIYVAKQPSGGTSTTS